MTAAAHIELTFLLTVLPIGFIRMMAILQQRHGGPAAAAVIAQSVPGLAGVAAAFLALYLLAVPIGTTRALVSALCVSILWNSTLFVLHRTRLATQRERLLSHDPLAMKLERNLP